MRVILHIGTHKTGSTSIQHFCATNRDRLRSNGIYYPLGRNDVVHLNQVASRIAQEREEEAGRILKSAIKYAKRQSAHTILISAESFYGMSIFFRTLQGRSVPDLWENERRCIATLRSLLPGEDVSVVCFLRRQDLFLESIYNQMVKNVFGWPGTIEDFLDVAAQLLDYAGHLDLWAEAFGADRLIVRGYGEDQGDVLGDFLRQAIGLRETSDFRPLVRRTNERLGRDVLEFKRVLNRLRLPREEALIASRALMDISRVLEQPKSWDMVLDLEDRRHLIDHFAAGNERIAACYLPDGHGPLFDDPDPAAVPTYPGLSVARAVEIMMRYERLISRPRVRAERLSRRIIRVLTQHVPVIDHLLWPIRTVLYRRLSHHHREPAE